MRPNQVKALAAKGEPVVNAWLSIGAPYAAEIVAHLGFDSVTVDCQHGMIDFAEAVGMFQAIATSAATPLVRPARNDPAEIMRYLDAGAYGVIVPMISSAADAEQLVSACRYPPTGGRSFGPSRGLTYGGADYFTHANDEILTMAMIETREGLADLDAIVAVPGLDGIYVGPNDLSLALGHPPRSECGPGEVEDAIAHILARTRAAGKLAGIFCTDGKAAADRRRQGFGLVTPGNDAGAIRAALGERLAASRA